MDELQVGEQLQTRLGPIAIVSTELLVDPQPVYNLEINGQHVYEVTELGILVHNTDNPLCELWELLGKSELTPEEADRLRELEKLWHEGKLVPNLTDSSGKKIPGHWLTPHEIGKKQAEKFHAELRDFSRKQNEGFESGRHNEHPGFMVRKITDEINRLESLKPKDAIHKMEIEGTIARLKEIRKTYERRDEGHRGGGHGSGY